MSEMPMRPLADSGLEVSAVGLGCNNFGGRVDLDGTRAVVDSALEVGVTFFDTADVYGNRGGSEELLGEALEGRRDRVVLATKFGMDVGGDAGLPDAPRGSREYIRAAVEASLRRLRTEVIDLYQYHAPDGVTPLEETLGALDELVREGRVRAIGCSNFSVAQLEEADRAARENGIARFVSVQNEYSLLERAAEREVIPTCERLGIAFVPYFPLARGLLTGKYRRGEQAPSGTRLAGRDEVASDAQFDAVEALERFAQERRIGLLDVAIGGLGAGSAVVSVIAGATRPDQVRANAAAGRWVPSESDLAELRTLLPAEDATGG